VLEGVGVVVGVVVGDVVGDGLADDWMGDRDFLGVERIREVDGVIEEDSVMDGVADEERLTDGVIVGVNERT